MSVQVTPQVLAEVHELLAAYGHAIDRGDAATWADLFHPDGTSAGPGRPTLVGRAALVAWLREHPRPDLQHTCSNVWVERVDPQGLHVVSHFVINKVDHAGAFSVLVAGSYRDLVVRHEGRLVFKCRVATPRSARRLPASR